MAPPPRKRSSFAVPKKMTLSTRKSTRKTPHSTPSSRNKASTQCELPQSFRGVRKASLKTRNTAKRSDSGRDAEKIGATPTLNYPISDTSHSPENVCITAPTTSTTPSYSPPSTPLSSPVKSFLATHFQSLSQKRAELARSTQALQCRQQKIWTSGIPMKKGGRMYPVAGKLFIVKVEDGEGNDVPLNHHARGQTDVDQRSELASEDEEQIRGRNLHPGLKFGVTFDKAYPGIAEMVANEMLDEQDEAGSLCDFINDDEEEYYTAEEE